TKACFYSRPTSDPIWLPGYDQVGPNGWIKGPGFDHSGPNGRPPRRGAYSDRRTWATGVAAAQRAGIAAPASATAKAPAITSKIVIGFRLPLMSNMNP